MPCVAVLGTGFVGATIAYALMHRGVADEIRLVDADPGRAVGEAMDLSHASLPCVLGRGGAVQVLEPPLEPEEVAALRRSASVLSAALASL